MGKDIRQIPVAAYLAANLGRKKSIFAKKTVHIL